MVSDSEAAHGMCMVIAVVVLAGHALSSAFARATLAPPLSFTSPNGKLVAIRNIVAFAFAIAGVVIITSQGHSDNGDSCVGPPHNATAGHDSHSAIASAHADLGWVVIALMVVQVFLALLAWSLGGGDAAAVSLDGQEMKDVGPSVSIAPVTGSRSSSGNSAWPVRLRQLHRWVGMVCMAIILCFQLWSGGESLTGWLTGSVLLIFSAVIAMALIGCSLAALRSQGGLTTMS